MTADEPTGVEVIEGEVSESRALAPRVESGTGLSVAPAVTADDLVTRLDTIKDAMAKAMRPDVDYGVIPGTNGKPTLLKPGAEKLGALFQLDIQIENEKLWHEDGHLTVLSHAIVYHQPTGTRLGGGEGICTTREAKYAFRTGTRECPTCGVAAVFKSKQGRDEFFCWAKKGGCGATFAAGTPEYEALKKADDRAPNPNIADTYNTVLKMASKRARIDAVLAVTGASAIFTQDMEDAAAGGAESAGAGTRANAPAPEQAKPAEGQTRPRPSTGPQRQKIAVLRNRLMEAGLSEEQYRAAVKKDYGVESATELSASQASELIEKLTEALKQMGVET